LVKVGHHQSANYSRLAREGALFWLLLEAGIALLILLFIVWWTWPRKKSDGDSRTGTDKR
jgi:hypothetical protein